MDLKTIIAEAKNVAILDNKYYIYLNCENIRFEEDLLSYYKNSILFYDAKKVLKVDSSLEEYLNGIQDKIDYPDKTIHAIMDYYEWSYDDMYFELTKAGFEYYKEIFSKYIEEEIIDIFIDIDNSDYIEGLTSISAITENFEYIFVFEFWSYGDKQYTVK